jgi:hypothetical protein
LSAAGDVTPTGSNPTSDNTTSEGAINRPAVLAAEADQDGFIKEVTELGQAAKVWVSPHPAVSQRGPASIKTEQQAALLLVALSQSAPENTVSEQAANLLIRSHALNKLPDHTLFRIAKARGTPLAEDALALRNEKLMPVYEKWLAEDEKLNDPLRAAILAVAASYPLHSTPSGFESDKLAILCSFAGGAYPDIQPEIQHAAANYVALHLKKVPFFALWALVLNLSDRPAPARLDLGPKLGNLEDLERQLERGKLPDEVALPWERCASSNAGDILGHSAANELCARLLVERERLPRETAFLFLGQRANALTAFVIATTVLPVVFPKLTPRQRLGLVSALALAAVVHAVVVPALNKVVNALSEKKYFAGFVERLGMISDKLKTRQHAAAELARDKLFIETPEVNKMGETSDRFPSTK